ncbi:adenine nucleotide alpha hydrolase [Cocleimonas sp. KMM 6892]|uniref:Dph6-related ATP pyrophosphatase n=1 Tax=unclassified Cocleimonas TaxID=2639732 RepID=UPI002DC02590|nr:MULTISPECIES: ATP-binding protein [unclassified Cocleimonas]MEB8432165.1 adenine nucleotide alpha hydrolase [Cocleimonas sp. KMM 6892]MEC4714749.1 adenine nucleotide alpha hydrolase [Cocleimonas sp. KMM 6895]MEC4744437.1 adenine nucleotide alpha hydrolase [Cocleimonas sp. KMM 6896]
MKQKILLSWSSGKDSAWALQQLLQNPNVEVVGLFSTINKDADRVAMHGVRVELLEAQAASIGIPLEIIEIPDPCSNNDYETIMSDFIEAAKKKHIECIAFGDLYLEDIRRYREQQLAGTGIEAIFPIWGLDTDNLSRILLDNGIKAVISCVDSKQLSEDFVGRRYNTSFLQDLPETADPCGENGEFHSYVYDAPMFKHAIEITLGKTFKKDPFVYIDVLPK